MDDQKESQNVHECPKCGTKIYVNQSEISVEGIKSPEVYVCTKCGYKSTDSENEFTNAVKDMKKLTDEEA